jgi:hypothetical protein
VTSSRTVGVLVAFVVLGSVAGLGRAAPARVSIAVALGAGTGGTFRITGGPVDAGRVFATRQVSRGRLLTRQALRSSKGTLVLSSSQACTRTAGTWKVVAGSGAYAGAGGGGTTRGRIGCRRPFKPTSVVHTGSLVVPPPPLATAGTYRGWTSQDREVSFDVTPDGRALVNLLFGGYGADCVQQQGLRRVEWSGVDHRVAGPVPIAEDRTFSIELGVGSRAAKVAGRFSAGTANGTISITYEWDAGGHFWKCAADVPWTVATPAPAPWQAVAGKYCGITPQGEGVCLDVPAGGRELRNLTAGIPLVCGETGFLVRLTIEGPFPLRSDLSFETVFTQPLGDDGSGRVFLSGTFDRAGSMTGRLTLQQPSFTYQGTRYTCRNGGAAWTAKRQS